MSDTDPYGDRRGGEQGEHRRDQDPTTGPWPRRPASGRSPVDPLTDPWSEPDPAAQRPRGRRRRPTETESDHPRERAPGRRRRAEPAGGTAEVADPTPSPPPARHGRSEPEDPPEPSPSRVLDFDSVPVRRKRPRGSDQHEEVGRVRRRGRAHRSVSGTRRRGRRRLLVAALVALFALVAGGGYVLVREYIIPPDYSGDGKGGVTITIPAGSSGSGIGQILEDKGVVASDRAFTNALTSKAAGELKPGTYKLRREMSAEAAIALLRDPEARVGAHVTVKEGLRAEAALKKVADTTDIPLSDLKRAYKDTRALGLPKYATKGPEGYLFPDTYLITPEDDATDVIRSMVQRYLDTAEEVSLEKRARERDMDANEVMAVASIVQAESGKHEDMPKIARVIYNRLDRNMALEMDSTCYYVIGKHGIAPNAKELAECKKDNSGYVTYGRKGLPAGPIGSPGKTAIEAALSPAKGDWMYFVATDPKNRVTEFAETHEEFLRLKEKYQEQDQGGG